MLKNVLLLLPLALLCSCAEDEVVEPPSATPAAPEPTVVEPTPRLGEGFRFHMATHLDRTKRGLDALIDGRLEDARAEARFLAEHPDAPDMPRAWRGDVESMRAAARSAAEAGDFAALGAGWGRLGATCGGCHRKRDVTVAAGGAAMPSNYSELGDHMAAHALGIRRAWAGLVGPSDRAWADGIRALSDDALPSSAFPASEEVGSRWVMLAAQVHATASGLPADASWGDRGAALGTILAACGECHVMLGTGPDGGPASRRDDAPE